MSVVHLVIGPVGAGKTTWCRALAARERAVHLNLDAWMTTLYGADPRPADRLGWYLERRDRCLGQILELAADLRRVGTPVILEIGMLRRAERAALYADFDDEGVELRVTVLDAPIEVRRERVMQRNRDRGPTFAVEVPPEVFELASAAWEPPDAEEREARNIVEP
ncbi:MAG: ATP-binding protein [Myxococcota bacterium]